MNRIIREDVLAMGERCPVMKELRGSTLLVTGATGFVGSFLIHALLADAAGSSSHTKIYAIVRNARAAAKRFGEYIENGYLTLLEQNVTEPAGLDRGVDYVLHCASNAGPREYLADPVGTILTNCIGTNNILSYAEKHGVKRVLYLSTIEIYGVQQSGGLISEDRQGTLNCASVRSCYPLSKQLAENLCVAYVEQKALPVVIGRLSYLYGPGMKPDDSKVVAEFARKTAAGEDLVLKSEGLQRRSYCYISDAAAGLLTVLVRGDVGQAYNIASEKNVTTIAGLAEAFVNCRPERQLRVRYDMPVGEEMKRFSPIRDAVLDNGRLRALGWESFVPLEEGVGRMVTSLEET